MLKMWVTLVSPITNNSVNKFSHLSQTTPFVIKEIFYPLLCRLGFISIGGWSVWWPLHNLQTMVYNMCMASSPLLILTTMWLWCWNFGCLGLASNCKSQHLVCIKLEGFHALGSSQRVGMCALWKSLNMNNQAIFFNPHLNLAHRVLIWLVDLQSHLWLDSWMIVRHFLMQILSNPFLTGRYANGYSKTWGYRGKWKLIQCNFIIKSILVFVAIEATHHPLVWQMNPDFAITHSCTIGWTILSLAIWSIISQSYMEVLWPLEVALSHICNCLWTIATITTMFALEQHNNLGRISPTLWFF